MAISVYDMVEGKWYVEMADGELLPCESQQQAEKLEDAPQQELEEYRAYLSQRGLLPRLQTIYETQ
mgnify:CR=1 FL=1|jgi:hypothetical protein|tara:strand:+ start:4077 stop:4274 length:198 start_codon:yes stop_codon:yes gene_type:complete